MGIIETIISFEKEEALLKGRREGRRQGRLEVARALKAEGLSLEQISRATKLSVEQIKKLKPTLS